MPERPGLEGELARALHRHAEALPVPPDLPRRITERTLARSRRRRRIVWGGIPAALGAGGIALGLGLSLGSAVPLAQRPHNTSYGAVAKPSAPRQASSGATTRTAAGASSISGATSAPPTASAAPSAAAGTVCAERTRAEILARARIVVIARALPGPTATLGHLHVLTSPARFAVVRYVRGHGPAVVEVTTGVTRASGSARVSSGGIRPLAGQTWEIVAPNGASPLDTSVCDGSHVVTSGGAVQP